jgi:radical SAM protein with 4Fe4S-binding SPASM domain
MNRTAAHVTERRTASVGEPFGTAEAIALPPDRLEIQPTANCHRTCSFCSHIVRNGRGGELSPVAMDRILREAEEMGIDRVSISGGGEPLIWNGPLARTIADTHEFAEVTLTTSGDQLWSDDREDLSDLALAILPHVDGFLLNTPGISDTSLRKQIRNGPDWDRVSHLLRALVAKRERADYRYALLCVVVVTRHNINDLNRIDLALHDLGVDRIYFKEFKIFSGEGRRRPRIGVDDEAMARARAAKRDTEISDELRRFLTVRARPAGPYTRCWAVGLGFNAIIDPRGDLYICTPTVGDSDYCVGNVVTDGMAAVWHGAARQTAVHSLAERSRSGNCPRDCRFHPHNQLMDLRVEGPQEGTLEADMLTNAGMDDFLA